MGCYARKKNFFFLAFSQYKLQNVFQQSISFHMLNSIKTNKYCYPQNKKLMRPCLHLAIPAVCDLNVFLHAFTDAAKYFFCIGGFRHLRRSWFSAKVTETTKSFLYFRQLPGSVVKHHKRVHHRPECRIHPPNQ